MHLERYICNTKISEEEDAAAEEEQCGATVLKNNVVRLDFTYEKPFFRSLFCILIHMKHRK